MASMNQRQRHTRPQTYNRGYQSNPANSQPSSQQTPQMSFPQGYILNPAPSQAGVSIYDMVHPGNQNTSVRAPTIQSLSSNSMIQQGMMNTPPPNMQQPQVNAQYMQQYQFQYPNPIAVSQQAYNGFGQAMFMPVASSMGMPMTSNGTVFVSTTSSVQQQPPPSETPQSQYSNYQGDNYQSMPPSASSTLKKKKKIIMIVDPNTEEVMNKDEVDRATKEEQEQAANEATASGRETTESARQSVNPEMSEAGNVVQPEQFNNYGQYYSTAQAPTPRSYAQFTGAQPAHENAFNAGGHKIVTTMDTSHPPPPNTAAAPFTPGTPYAAQHSPATLTEEVRTPKSQMKEEFFTYIQQKEQQQANDAPQDAPDTTQPPPSINTDGPVIFKSGAEKSASSVTSTGPKTPVTPATTTALSPSPTNDEVIHFAGDANAANATNVSYEFGSQSQMTHSTPSEVQVAEPTEPVSKEPAPMMNKEQDVKPAQNDPIANAETNEAPLASAAEPKKTEREKEEAPVDEAPKEAHDESAMENEVIGEEEDQENDQDGDDGAQGRYSLAAAKKLLDLHAQLVKIYESNPKMYNPNTGKGSKVYSSTMLRLCLEMQKITRTQPSVDKKEIKNSNFIDCLETDTGYLAYFDLKLRRNVHNKHSHGSSGMRHGGGSRATFGTNKFDPGFGTRSTGAIPPGRYTGGRGSRAGRTNAPSQGGRIVIDRPSMANIKLHEQSEENKFKSTKQKLQNVADETEKAKLEAVKNVTSDLNRMSADTFGYFVYDHSTKKKGTWFDHYRPEYAHEIIAVLFEKAIDEPKYCSLYSEICKLQSDEDIQTSTNKVSHFRRCLLETAQKAFESKEYDDETLRELAIEIKQAKKAQEELEAKNVDSAEGKAERRAAKEKLEQLEERMFKARKRMFGIINFIGLLYARKIIPLSIVHSCFIRLYNRFKDRTREAPGASKKKLDEEAIECSIRLYQSVGYTILNDAEGNAKCAMADRMAKPEVRLSIYLKMLSDTKPHVGNRLRFAIEGAEVLKADNALWHNYTVDQRAKQAKTKEAVKKEAEKEKRKQENDALQAKLSATASFGGRQSYSGRGSYGGPSMPPSMSAPQNQRGGNMRAVQQNIVPSERHQKRVGQALGAGGLSSAFATMPRNNRFTYAGRQSGESGNATPRDESSESGDKRAALAAATSMLKPGKSAPNAGGNVVPSPSTPTLSAMARENDEQQPQRRASQQVHEHPTIAEPTKEDASSLDLEDEDKKSSATAWLKSELNNMKLLTNASTSQEANDIERANDRIIKEQLEGDGWRGTQSTQERVAFALIGITEINASGTYKTAIFLARLLARVVEHDDTALKDVVDAVVQVVEYDQEMCLSEDAPYFHAALGTLLGELLLRSRQRRVTMKRVLTLMLADDHSGMKFELQKVLAAALEHIAGLSPHSTFKEIAVYSPEPGADAFSTEATDAGRIQRLAQVWTTFGTETIDTASFKTQLDWQKVCSALPAPFCESMKTGTVAELAPPETSGSDDDDDDGQTGQLLSMEREFDSLLKNSNADDDVPANVSKTIQAIKQLMPDSFKTEDPSTYSVPVVTTLSRAAFKSILVSDEMTGEGDEKYQKQVERLNSLAAPVLSAFANGNDECEKAILFALADRALQLQYPQDLLTSIIDNVLIPDEDDDQVISPETMVGWFDELQQCEKYKTQYAMLVNDGSLQTYINDLVEPDQNDES